MYWLPKYPLLGKLPGRIISNVINKLTRFKQRALQIVLLGLALLLLQTSLTAALAENPPTTDSLVENPLTAEPLVKNPLKTPDTSSPQATLRSFLDNVNRAHQLLMESYNQYQKDSGLFPSTSVREQFKQAKILFNRAEHCLNLSETPVRLKRNVALEGTLLLKEILDRIKVPSYAEIPDAEAVAANEKLSHWVIPDTEIDIVKVEEGPRAGQFLFSPETVARLKEFYQKVKNLPYKPGATAGFYQFYISTPGSLIPSKINMWFQNFPSWLNTRYWGQTLWQWISLGISLLIAFWFPYRIFRWNSQQITALDPPQRTWSRLLPPLIAVASLAAVSNFLDYWVNITGDVLFIILIPLRVIFWIMVALTIFLFGNVLAETIIALPKINSQGIDASAARITFRLSSLTIGAIILILGIERVGISLIPIFAGLGIGGLALALAGQKSIEDVIAGLILFADGQVKVGERICFGDREGYLKEIGLHSTIIRALNGDLISMPNSQFSELELVNKSRQKGILLRQTIGLRYETTSEQLRFVLVKLREMILAHPKLLEERARVRFVKYGDYSKDVEIFVYVDTNEVPEFLGIQEDVLLRVQDLIEAAGTDFAFPSQTAYISSDSGIDRERSCAAEAEVQDWRSKGTLPFPEFSSEQREQFRDTLDFPPEGSPR